ncbi:MAG: putative DNA binding domain-containing protein [Eubacteriales bacterium]|nr:putative DNA binding domain-containing protein [Eubacteriales bacterium]
MDSKALKTIFEIGETIAVEFKRCGNGIESDAYETVCSFLNRFGGELFLGVLDDGTVSGVPEAIAPDLVKNFISCVSNPALFSPTVYLSPKIIKYEDKTIIHIHIPPSAEVHSFRKVIYDRVDDSDVKVTATAQIAQMYIRKQDIFTERKIYPYVKMEDLRLDLLPKFRIMAANNNSGAEHPWSSMSDEELLKSARLYGTDRITGAQGYNLAAIMLLGRDEVILDIAPAYLTDALLRRVDIDRYDDREIIQTNLVESYERLMEFGRKHLPDKFFLEGDQRKSLRSIIVREMIANTLIHREYTSSYQAKFVIENDRMYVENANRSAQNSIITPENMEPNPKNPIIASFFRNIGYADQLGSGVRNLFKYCKYYSGGEPEFIENDIFRIVVPLNDNYLYIGSQDDVSTTTQSATQSATQSTTRYFDEITYSGDIKVEQDITILIQREPGLSQKQIAERLSRNVNTVKYYMRKMQEQGRIKHVGSPRKGKWIVK